MYCSYKHALRLLDEVPDWVVPQIKRKEKINLVQTAKRFRKGHVNIYYIEVNVTDVTCLCDYLGTNYYFFPKTSTLNVIEFNDNVMTFVLQKLIISYDYQFETLQV